MTHNWIIMPIEVQRRELDAKLIVATLAAGRGFKTIIGRDQMVRRMAAYLPKGILFDKSIEGNRDSKVSRYHRLGYRITAMDEEGTGFLMAPEAFMRTRLSNKTLNKTSRWFCINEAVRDICVAEFPDHQEKFVTTGLGRTDTWRKQFQGLFESEAKAIRAKVGKFILFNSNFATVNHARGEAFVLKQMKRTQALDKTTAEDDEKLLRENTANLVAYTELLPKLLEWFPEHTLVIRPHPGEYLPYWTDRFGDNNRVVFSSGGVVTPWILASDIVLHHGCTTGVEAELMEQAQVNYAPIPDEHHDGEIPRAFSHFVYNEKDLHSVMTEMLSGTNNYRKPRAGLERWFACLDGTLVAEKVVDEFDKLRFSARGLSPLLPIARLLPRNLVARFKNLSSRSRAYSAQKFEGMNVEMLNTKLEVIAGALGQERPPRARQIFDELYMVESDPRA